MTRWARYFLDLMEKGTASIVPEQPDSKLEPMSAFSKPM